MLTPIVQSKRMYHAIVSSPCLFPLYSVWPLLPLTLAFAVLHQSVGIIKLLVGN